MKKIFLLSGFAIFGIFSCSKSSNEANEPTSNNEVSKINPSQDFALNNLKLSAATVREWLSNESIQQIVFTFFSKDLANIGANMTLSAYAYEKSSATMPLPVLLEIGSRSSLQIQSDITLPNNQISINKIKRMVSNEAGIIDFDYLLFEPKYYILQSNTYVSYNITAYKNDKPINIPNSLTAGGTGGTNPSPPADPSGGG